MRKPSAPARLQAPLRAVLLVSASVLALGAPAAAEGPQGGAVARGKATIATSAGRTTIRQTSRRAIVDWKRFDVSRDHTVTFDQPGRKAATLNRVARGGGRSVIEGAVRAPGTVVIQNGAGVLFTRGARVDVGGLVAASQDIDAARFQKDGRLVIGGGETAGARVANEGRITVGEKGLAALVGGSVENSGVIMADRGTVALASGARTTLDLAGDGVFRIAVEGDAAGTAPGVANPGVIDVGGGRVLLTAGAAAKALDAAINTTGLIRAASATGDGGVVELVGRGAGAVRISGAIDAAGAARGGDVAATGARIELGAAARIDASGGGAGGRIRLGGDRHGAGALRRAEGVAVAAGARIDATGGTGAGGEVTLWSDGLTDFHGAIRAGGAASGGSVETSGAAALSVGDAAAVEVGLNGTWLLDPRDVMIVSGAGETAGAGVTNPGATGSGPYYIDAGAIVSTLNGGGDVTVTTFQPAFSQNGDITVASGVSWSGAGDLTLDADGSVLVSANLQATGSGGLTLLARKGDVTIGSGGGARVVSTNTGALRLEATRGDVRLERLNAQPSGVQAFSASGGVDVVAGDEIVLQGGASGGRWVRLGRSGDASDLRLDAPTIRIRGGSAGNAFAEVVAGAGGSIEMNADLIEVTNGLGDQGRIQATDGATLTLLGERQVWNGPVRSGTGGNNGGEVVIAGAIAAGFQPQFSLLPDAGFTFRPAAPGGAASRYDSTEPFAVDLIPTLPKPNSTGRIDIDAPVSASQITLETIAGVRLGQRGTLAAAGWGDAIIVAAGAQFLNQSASGADAFALDDPEGRWLLYVDRFDGLDGPAPGPRDFDLYGRSYEVDAPLELGFDGDRIVYGERPTLTLTGGTFEKTYGENLPLGWGVTGYGVAGLRPGDSLAVALDGAPVASSAGASPWAPASGTPYALDVAAVASAQGYRLVTVPGRVAVGRAPLTVTTRDARRAYGGGDPAFSVEYEGFVNDENGGALGGRLAFASDATRTSDVGLYGVTASGLASGNYDISYVAGTLTIDPATAQVHIAGQSRTYGSAAFDERGFSVTGLVLGQDKSVIAGALATDATSSSNVGRYGITGAGLTSGNYVLTIDGGVLEIDPACLTLTIADQSRTYGSAAFDARAFTATGFVLGQDASVLTGALATDATTTSNVGAYAIGKGTLAAANYILTANPGTLTIDPARLTLTIADQSRTYGSSAFDGRAFTATGFVLGQDKSVLTGALAADATASSNVGAYAIGKGALAAANYVLAADPGTLTIDPARLTVTIADQSRTYGSATFDARAFTASGYVLGQDASVLTGALATDATASSNVGAYAIGKGTLAAANYIVAADPGALTIDPARLTVSIADQSRTYGSAAFDARAFTATGFVLGQDKSVLTGALHTEATQASDVGDYGIVQGTLAAANYLISSDPGTLAIDPATLTIAIADQSRSYGSAALDRRAFTASGFVLGQTADVLTGALATRGAATSNVGAYEIGKGTLAAENYLIAARPGTLTIDPARMRVRANDASRPYGAANPRFDVSYLDPFAPGQSAAALGWHPAVATTATRTSDVGVYALTPGGVASANYAVEYLPGRLTIDPVRLSLTLHDQDRSYGAATPDLGWTATGFVLGQGAEAISGAPATTAAAASGAGTYTITTGTLHARNYVLPETTATLTVTPAPPTVTANDPARLQGARNP
uniref:MBG domain-containing protein n=1 Tax=Amaricoccus sp. TaxID=1872485 RepID=UPI001B4D721D